MELNSIKISQNQEGILQDIKKYSPYPEKVKILFVSKYLGIEEQEDDGEPFEEKMTRLTSELSDMFKKSHELEEEIRKKLGSIGYEIQVRRNCRCSNGTIA